MTADNVRFIYGMMTFSIDYTAFLGSWSYLRAWPSCFRYVRRINFATPD